MSSPTLTETSTIAQVFFLTTGGSVKKESIKIKSFIQSPFTNVFIPLEEYLGMTLGTLIGPMQDF